VVLVAYARQSSSANEAPTVEQHWHIAYAFNKCGTELGKIQDNNESASSAGYELYQTTGIHTHGDGVVHVHPFTSAGAGRNATLGTWFKQVGVKASSDKVELPEGLGTMTQDENCKVGDQDKPGKLKALVWKDATADVEPDVYITGFNDIRFTKDGMAITIALVPDGTDLKTLKPSSAKDLAALGAVDQGAATPSASSTTAPGTGSSTASSADTSASSSSTASTTATTAPASSSATTATTAPASSTTSQG
jgi:hypothetical protein